MIYLSCAEIISIHETVIEANEVQGQAINKSIEAIISRIENRISYGLIRDIYELAACYACYIAMGHAFHDANKRTAFVAMDLCLLLNGIELVYRVEEVGPLIIEAAQGIVDETELAEWLRVQSLV
ncbi:type II toxin-antitoxin system death-on-curing family toxin [Pseudomonadota bacterium]